MYVGRVEVYTGFWLGNLRDRDHFENPGVRWEDNIRIDIQEVEWGGAWTGLLWLRIGTGGRNL